MRRRRRLSYCTVPEWSKRLFVVQHPVRRPQRKLDRDSTWYVLFITLKNCSYQQDTILLTALLLSLLIVRHTDNNNLVGELPEELSDLATLQKLNFDNNGLLFGAIPTTLGDLNQLEELDLGSNMFSGVIPEQLFSATNLIRIDLDNNNITGSIPSAIGNLQDLDTLQLDLNFLTGPLESRIGELGLLSKCHDFRLVFPASQP
jgi:Leucine-rich repeat (LRR) protein